MRFSAGEVAEYAKGSLAVAPAEAEMTFEGITWDSRAVKPRDLYAALPGERVNGHAFIAAALRAGAMGALVSEEPNEEALAAAQELGAAIVHVQDVRAAIVDLARAWRNRLEGTVIALTGSTGKTTTKNLVRDVASSAFRVVATQGNQNNELGVPNTILRADVDTQVVVTEMGMRGSNQIAALCEFVRPDWGIINNVGDAHIELLGSREAIACAKTELFEGLRDGVGIAFANAADDYCDFACERAELDARGVRTVYFNGERGECCVWATDAVLDAQGCPSFTLHARGFGAGDEQQDCHMVLRGMHNVSNACAAAAVGRTLGIPLAQVADALAHALPEDGRQVVVQTADGVSVIDDTYNANPDSMMASLRMFASMEVAGRRIAVLGDMAELGDYAPALHARIGEGVAELPIDYLICCGTLARNIADSAKNAGMSGETIVCADTIAQVLEQLKAILAPGDAVLAKASNCMNLKQVVKGLVE